MDGYLTSQDIAGRLDAKLSSVHRMRSRGDLPAPDEVVGRTPMWRVETIDRWLTERPSHRWHRGTSAAPETD